MSTKHTPGPWKIAGEDAEKQTFIYALNERGSNRFWFDIQPGWTDDKQRTSSAELSANALLIAAAPELLEALRAITDQLERIGDTRYDKDGQYIDAARAAIAKATGEQA
jgi:hypothetical protein